MKSSFTRERVDQCSYGRASAYVRGQNLLTSDVIYQESVRDAPDRPGLEFVFIAHQ